MQQSGDWLHRHSLLEDSLTKPKLLRTSLLALEVALQTLVGTCMIVRAFRGSPLVNRGDGQD